MESAPGKDSAIIFDLFFLTLRPLDQVSNSGFHKPAVNMRGRGGGYLFHHWPSFFSRRRMAHWDFKIALLEIIFTIEFKFVEPKPGV
jgi:hypothetical protein